MHWRATCNHSTKTGREDRSSRPLFYAFSCCLLLACLVKLVLEVREHLAHAAKLHTKTLSCLVRSSLRGRLARRLSSRLTSRGLLCSGFVSDDLLLRRWLLEANILCSNGSWSLGIVFCIRLGSVLDSTLCLGQRLTQGKCAILGGLCNSLSGFSCSLRSLCGSCRVTLARLCS